MPIIPDLFVTPHAVEQFQQRIAPMDAARARQIILDGVRQATNVRVLPDGLTLRIRTQRPFPFEFRAYCVFDAERGHPVVTTIVRGASNVTRKQKHRGNVSHSEKEPHVPQTDQTRKDEVVSPEPILISALNQYVFCPRRCALMHVEGIWSDNEHTTIGTLLHEHSDTAGYESDGEVTLLRALPLYSSHYGLVGQADIVEMRAGIPSPVEYKKGKRRQFDNDDIQLCAQALCLEEMFGVTVETGCIYHAASKRRRRVVFTEDLRRDTLQTIAAVRLLLAESRVPPAILKPRCDGCSLRSVCLPELTGAEASAARQEEYQRQLASEG